MLNESRCAICVPYTPFPAIVMNLIDIHQIFNPRSIIVKIIDARLEPELNE